MSRRPGPWVLGISASHNGAACLLRGDEIAVAVQEERLSRVKRSRIHGARPSLAVAYCLEYAGISPSDLSMIVLCPQGSARSPAQDLTRNPQLDQASSGVPTMTIPHHLGHAVSAFATSGFERSAVLVVDGLGSPDRDFLPTERAAVVPSGARGWESISLYAASGTTLTPIEKHVVAGGKWLASSDSGLPRFRSLGGMYSSVARYLFGNPMDAGKVMGLAPYGTAVFPPESFFEFSDGTFRFKDDLPRRFRQPRRWPRAPRGARDLARSVQEALELALLELAARARRVEGGRSLCLAGGVALNGIANERIIRESGFDDVYVVPAAEDSGPSIGAAYYGAWQLGLSARRRLRGDALGRRYSVGDISTALTRVPAVEARASSDPLGEAVERLCRGQIGGWFCGRSELGPRALGQRSILADPRRADTKAFINSRVKFRESFRPLAPAVLEERAADWFEMSGDMTASPFMTRVCPIKPGRRKRVPAVAHVDGTGRLQTVSRATSARFHALLRRFEDRTGIPMLLNTSFNVCGEPIVETPEDALWCFLASELDFCVLEDRIVTKRKGVRSILDLYPRIVGARPPRLSAHASAALDLIDGRGDGWSLSQRLTRRLGARPRRPALETLLLTLARASIVALGGGPWPR